MKPLATIGGLLFRPSATLWKLREEGSIAVSIAIGIAFGGGLVTVPIGLPEVLTGHSQPLWAGLAASIIMSAGVFTATVLLMHAAAVLVWRVGPSPVMGGRLNTLLRLGGYMGLPAALVSLVQWVVIPAVRSGSVWVAHGAFYFVVAAVIAAGAWSLVFDLRLLRTVYLTTWGGAIAITVVAWILAGALSAVNPLAAGSASVRVNWYLHRALGANDAAVDVLESLPQGGGGESMVNVDARAVVIALRADPAAGDLVAYYSDREAPPLRRSVRLPSPIGIGRVVSVEGARPGTGDSGCTEMRVSIQPVGTDEHGNPLPIDTVPRANVAGLVPETVLWLHKMVAALLR